MARRRRPEGPIDICSYKRSGTHFLAHTISKNFNLPDVSIPALVRENKRFVIGPEEWTAGDTLVIPWGGLWCSHNFFNPRWFNDPRRILYIVRHPVDTLMSLWRLMDPERKGDLKQFLGKTNIEAWFKHARGYTENCRWIRYEDLVGEKHDETLDQIASWFHLDSKYDGYMRVKSRVGWYSAQTPTQPKKPTKKVIETFKEVIPDGFLGYDIG